MFTKENALRVINVKHGKNEKRDFVFLSPYKNVFKSQVLKISEVRSYFRSQKVSSLDEISISPFKDILLWGIHVKNV